jgi:Calcineurin-like phosphoesterase
MKVLATVFGLLMALAVQAETWSFAVIGDTPYSDYERRELPIMLQNLAEEHPAFVVHAGDIKASNGKCSDRLFLDRFALFNASTIPFIYVPGDNEWTDCKRLVAGHFSEQERLNRLRGIFFSEPLSLGKTRIHVERQSANFPEHLRWRLGEVLFISLNIPGPNNNYGMGQEASTEFLDRNPFVIDWLKQGFANARREKTAGIVIVMQGNPGFKHFSAGLAHSGFRELLEVLRSETLAYTGQVLLVHGDTHWQRIDHPLRHPVTKKPIANFTRLETFGYPFMGWVNIIIDSTDPSLFRFDIRTYNPN